MHFVTVIGRFLSLTYNPNLSFVFSFPDQIWYFPQNPISHLYNKLNSLFILSFELFLQQITTNLVAFLLSFIIFIISHKHLLSFSLEVPKSSTDLTGPKSKCLGLPSFLETLAGNLLPCLFRCCQNSVACGTETPFSCWVSTENCSQLPEAPLHPLACGPVFHFQRHRQQVESSSGSEILLLLPSHFSQASKLNSFYGLVISRAHWDFQG